MFRLFLLAFILPLAGYCQRDCAVNNLDSLGQSHGYWFRPPSTTHSGCIIGAQFGYYYHGKKVDRWVYLNCDGTLNHKEYYSSSVDLSDTFKVEYFYKDNSISERGYKRRVFIDSMIYEDPVTGDIKYGEGIETYKIGLWQFFKENGKLEKEGHFIDDKETGEWKQYDDNGGYRLINY